MSPCLRIGLVFCLLAGALRTGPIGAQVRIDTVRGIPVIRNGSGIWQEGEEWTLTEHFRLGSDDGPPEALFSNLLTAVTIGPRGNLYILDYMSREIRLFDPEGNYRLTFGGSGRGPGELFDPPSLGWDAWDRLWVRNFDGRFTVFDSVGDLIKTTPLQEPTALDSRLYRMHFNPDGSFVDHASVHGAVQLLLRDTTATVIRRLALLSRPYDPPAIVAIRLSEETRVAVRTFRPKLVWTFGPDGTVWVGRSDELRMVQLTLGGDTLRIVETTHREPSFSQQEKRLVDRARREVEEDVLFTPVVLQSIHVLDDGYVLAQIADEMGTPGRIFDVFDPEGRFLGSMSWPFAPHPLAVHASEGNTFVAVTLGDLDVPYIVKATLNRPGGGK